MTNALPWVGLITAIVLFLLEKPKEAQPKVSFIAAPLTFILGTVGLVAAGLWQGVLYQNVDLAIIAGLLSVLVAVTRPTAIYTHIGLAAVACSAHGLTMHTDPLINPFWISTIAGLAAACGAWAAKSSGAVAFGGLAMAGAFMDRLTPPGSGSIDGYAGSLLLLAGALGAIVAVLFASSRKLSSSKIGAVIGVLLMLGAGYAMLKYSSMDSQMSVLLVASSVLALIIAWMFPEEGGSGPSKATIAGLIWMGAATYAFSTESRFGMALLLGSALITLTLVKAPRLAATVSPVFALVAFKTIREDFPDMTRAFDIAQHYSMIGIIVGVGIIMVASEWAGRISDRPSVPRLAAFGLVGLTMATTVLFSLVFFGQKGGIGLVVGLGMAAWFMVAVGRSFGGAFTASVGLVGIVGLGYPSMSEFFDTSRQEKNDGILCRGFDSSPHRYSRYSIVRQDINTPVGNKS
ncbi:hypothetical protein QPK87_32145 [Kamptonema cortianum]|nr:hypothetical protein [Kamptonema cortianum]